MTRNRDLGDVAPYVDGVSSNIQTQIDAKQGTISVTADRALISNGSGAVAVSTVTSTQLATVPNLAPIANPTFTGVVTTPQVNVTAQGSVRMEDAAGGEYAAFQAPTTLTASYIMTMPPNTGSAGEFLSTNGSGVLSFAAPSGGAWNLVAEVTPSSSATVELTGMDSTYVTYVIIASDVLLSSSDNITFTFKQGGSYVNSGYYASMSRQYSGSSTITGESYENGTYQRITENNPPTNNFVMYIYNPSNASSRTAYYVRHVGSDSGTAYRTTTDGMQNTAGAVTAILFDCGNATFSSGSFKLYGIGG